MSPSRPHPPIPLLIVLDRAVDAVLGGSWGWLHIPPGGRMDATWMPTKGCYRLTIDVTAGHELSDIADAFNQETRHKLEAMV